MKLKKLSNFQFKKIMKTIICYFLNRLIDKSKIIVIYGNNCHEQKDAIFNRVNFFFETKNISKCRDLGRLNFIYVFYNGQKLFFGLKTIPLYFISELFFYNIDPCCNPLDGWVYHTILSKIDPFTENICKKSRDRFNNLMSMLYDKKLLKSYLFGTGSSLEKAITRDWNDGYKIVCNTIVKDKELWHHLNPDIIVAGDAIYHFSENLFATAFRHDLASRLEETEQTVFIYPSIFHPFVKTYFKKFENRLIPIPVGHHNNFVHDLTKDFSLPQIGNILNLLLLPLGMTLSKNIYLWGFNGRAPDDKDFWKNSNKHFYTNLVFDIKSKHPQFFNHYVPAGNQAKYVETFHGDNLEIELTEAETKGWSFNMMHFSYTPALKKRIINQIDE